MVDGRGPNGSRASESPKPLRARGSARSGSFKEAVSPLLSIPGADFRAPESPSAPFNAETTA